MGLYWGHVGLYLGQVVLYLGPVGLYLGPVVLYLCVDFGCAGVGEPHGGGPKDGMGLVLISKLDMARFVGIGLVPCSHVDPKLMHLACPREEEDNNDDDNNIM